MKKNEKDVLLKDLSARLQRGVKVYTSRTKEPSTLMGLVDGKVFVKHHADSANQGLVEYDVENDQVKPYLFPLSKLKEKNYAAVDYFHHDTLLDELIYKLNQCQLGRVISRENFDYEHFGVLWFYRMEKYECVPHQAMNVVIDFLDAHHIDHRGLIEMEQAIDCSNRKIY